MGRRSYSAAILIVILCLGVPANAQETFTLKDGSVVTGKVIGESDSAIIIRTATGMKTVAPRDVEKREKGLTKTTGASSQKASRAHGLRKYPNPSVRDPKVDQIIGARDRKKSSLPSALTLYFRTLPPDRVLDIVMTIYYETDDEMVRTSIPGWWSHCTQAKRFLLAVETWLQDRSEHVRRTGLKAILAALNRTPDDEVLRAKVDAFLKQSLRTSHDILSSVAFHEAAKLWGREGIETLMKHAPRTPDPRRAYDAVGGMKLPESDAAIKRCYRTQPSQRENLRWALEAALGKTGASAFKKVVQAEDKLRPLAWRLRLPVRAEFVDTPISEVASYLQESVAVTVRIDPDIDKGAPITFSFGSRPLRDDLYYLCFQHGLTFKIERDHVRITKGPMPPRRSRGRPSAKLKSLLARKTTFQFVDTPATVAFDFLRTLTRQPIAWSKRAYEKAQKTSITITAKDITLGSVVQKIAGKVGARVVYRGDTIELH